MNRPIAKEPMFKSHAIRNFPQLKISLQGIFDQRSEATPVNLSVLLSAIVKCPAMLKIGLLSDTHGSLNPKAFDFFKDCDEIWHAGDIGLIKVADQLSSFKTLRAVYGNIDGTSIRSQFPEILVFSAEEVKVLMIHVGGYPGHYPPAIRNLIAAERPKLFICGHSHILKVIYDQKVELLHINPGAAGHSGLHKSITMIRFVIDRDNIKDLEILDIPRKT